MYQLRPQPDFRDLLEQLYTERALVPYLSGATIPMHPEELIVVCRGVVQLLTIQTNGDETMLGLAGPSMPIGLPLTLVDPYQAIALTSVDVLRLSMAEVETSPALAAGLARHLMLRLRQSEAWLSLSGKRPVSGRLRQLLLLITQEFGQTTSLGTRITLRLTHQHLANAIGATRVTITRLINEFRAEGWLTVDQQRHLVVDVAKLEPLL